MEKDSYSYNIIMIVDNIIKNKTKYDKLQSDKLQSDKLQNDITKYNIRYGILYGNEIKENTKVICSQSILGKPEIGKDCMFARINFIDFVNQGKYYQALGFDYKSYKKNITEKHIQELLSLKKFKYKGYKTEEKILYCLGKNINKFTKSMKNHILNNELIVNTFF